MANLHTKHGDAGVTGHIMANRQRTFCVCLLAIGFALWFRRERLGIPPPQHDLAAFGFLVLGHFALPMTFLCWKRRLSFTPRAADLVYTLPPLVVSVCITAGVLWSWPDVCFGKFIGRSYCRLRSVGDVVTLLLLLLPTINGVHAAGLSAASTFTPADLLVHAFFSAIVCTLATWWKIFGDMQLAAPALVETLARDANLVLAQNPTAGLLLTLALCANLMPFVFLWRSRMGPHQATKPTGLKDKHGTGAAAADNAPVLRLRFKDLDLATMSPGSIERLQEACAKAMRHRLEVEYGVKNAPEAIHVTSTVR